MRTCGRNIIKCRDTIYRFQEATAKINQLCGDGIKLTHNSDHSSSLNFLLATKALTVGCSHNSWMYVLDASSILPVSSIIRSSTFAASFPLTKFLSARFFVKLFSIERACHPLRTNTPPFP